MRRIVIGLVITAALVALATSGRAVAGYSDMEAIFNVFQAGTLEVKLLDETWSGELEPGSSKKLTLMVANPSTLPLDYRVTAKVTGFLKDAVLVTTRSSGHLNPGQSEPLEVLLTMVGDEPGEYEGKEGKLRLRVTAYQQGHSRGFTDEKGFASHFSTVIHPPEVRIQTPRDGKEIAGMVTIRAHAKDNFEVSSVSLYMDGTLLGDMRKISPHEFRLEWDSSTSSLCDHWLTAQAWDAVGQKAEDTISFVTPDHCGDE